MAKRRRSSGRLLACALLAPVIAAAATTDERGARASAGTDKVLCHKRHGPKRGYHMLLIKGREFGDCVFEAILRRSGGVTHYGLVFRYKDERNLYRLVLRTGQKDFRVEKVLDGKSDYATARHVSFPSRANRWYRVRLVARGPHVEVWIDGKRMYSRDGFGKLASGRAGVTVFDKALAEFDGVRVTAPDGKEVQFQDDFGGGRLDRWEIASREGVKGEWAAQPKHPVLAVARAVADGGDIIAGVLRSPERRWSAPFLVAKAPGLTGGPVVAQACDGTILCAFPAGPVMMVTTSRDGGGTWPPPTRTVVEGAQGSFLFTSPPVESGDGSWLVAVASGIFRSKDGGTTWSRVAECPGAGAGGKRLVEPSLALARGGRWAVLARQADAKGKGDALAVTVSSDRGKTWGEPRVTRLKGLRPELVELFDSLFIAVAEGADGRLSAAFAWDELHHFQVKPLSCGYCVRATGRKHLARGSGADVAGEFNNLSQVPLRAAEVAAAKGKATARLAASGDAFKLKGEWKRIGDKAGATALASTDSAASVEVEFDGPVVFLVHDAASDGRLVGVRIDGHEYPPVDMKGSAKSSVRTCLAADLGPGRHKLSLWCLLRWRAGTMTVRAIEVAK